MGLPERKPLRLSKYDYSQNGAYFVTVCLDPRLPRFGEIRRGDPCGRPPIAPYVEHTVLGQIAEETFSYLEQLYPVTVPVHMVMPDHIHAIVVLEQRATARVAPTLGRVIGAYKSKVSTRYLSLCKQQGVTMGSLWQQGYYEHVIRNQADFDAAAEYILTNPARRLEREASTP